MNDAGARMRIWVGGLITALLAGATYADESFLAHCRERAETAVAAGRMVVEGRDEGLFFVPELRHLGAGAFWGEAAVSAGRAAREDARDPLPAILDFHRALNGRGIDLVLVPVPPKAVVKADWLVSEAEAPTTRPDVHHQAFYTLLRKEGLTVLDLTDVFRDWSGERRGPSFCRQDTHWSGEACVEAARRIAEAIRPMLDVRTDENSRFPVTWETVELTGDLWRMKDAPALTKETLPVRTVSGARTTDPASPVVLVGDSHTLVFHAGGDLHARSAGLPDQLAHELGLPVDLAGVRGSGATPARINLFRRAQRDAGYWNAKRVVVWVFTAREFTESEGWRIVPLAP